jgi:hypothetical protein
MRNNSPSYGDTRLQQALIVAVSLAMVLLLTGCLLGLAAVHQRVIPPPAFSVQLVGVEIAGPCPSRVITCDKYPPFYALWRGDRQPDGRMVYRQLFFVYLRPTRR